MVKPVKIEKTKLEKESYLIWNAFIDIISYSETEELNDVQSVAQLAWMYDSEVQNGGHLQYFENKSIAYKEKLNIFILATLEALKIIGAKNQEKILTNASKQYFKQRRKHPSTVDEYSEIAVGDEFEKFDNKYYECSPNITGYLEKFLRLNQNQFVELV